MSASIGRCCRRRRCDTTAATTAAVTRMHCATLQASAALEEYDAQRSKREVVNIMVWINLKRSVRGTLGLPARHAAGTLAGGG